MQIVLRPERFVFETPLTPIKTAFPTARTVVRERPPKRQFIQPVTEKVAGRRKLLSHPDKAVRSIPTILKPKTAVANTCSQGKFGVRDRRTGFYSNMQKTTARH